MTSIRLEGDEDDDGGGDGDEDEDEDEDEESTPVPRSKRQVSRCVFFTFHSTARKTFALLTTDYTHALQKKYCHKVFPRKNQIPPKRNEQGERRRGR